MRPLQNQLQDLADYSAGVLLDNDPRPEDFREGPLRDAWCAISRIEWDGDDATHNEKCRAAMREAMGSHPNGMALYLRILRVITSKNEHPFPSLAEIAAELRPVEWLWRGWLARGMVHLVAARPGTGKSMLALDLAGRVMTGSPWPDGAPNDRPAANVIYVDAENIPEVHNARAVAWGLPRKRLYLVRPDEEDILVDLSSQKYQELLGQMVYRLRPGLVIIDSLGGSMGRGENAVEDVRGVLAFLSGLSQHHGVAVLIVHHLRKSMMGQMAPSDTIDPDQIRGSGHITAMSRVIWGLALVQTGAKADMNGPRKLQVIKSTLARHPEPLGMVLEPIPAADEEEEQVRVVYDAAAPEPYHLPTERDAAAEWLLEYLASAGKPVAPKDAIAAGIDAGFSQVAIYRARRELDGQIHNTLGWRAKGNCWGLPGEESDTSDTITINTITLSAPPAPAEVR